jgi:phage tail-like protein
MVNQLPVGMVQDDFFVRFVSIFQDVATSLLEGADNLEHIPDLTVTPSPLISVLAAWIGAEAVDANLPEGLQRTLLARSGRAMSQRGTVDGLRQYLEMLSDGPAEVIDGGGIWPEGDAPPDVAWVRMQVQGTGHLSEDEFVRMVRHQVPAHVRAELFIADRRVLATAEAASPTKENHP